MIWPFRRQSIKDARREFFELLEQEFHALLLGRGFRGRRPHWSRLRLPFIDCVNVQNSKYHDRCCVNLGVHLDFLPVYGHEGPLNAPKLRAYECEFKARLTARGDYPPWWDFPQGDQWWQYRRAQKSARDLIRVFDEHADRFFRHFEDFPHPFVDFSPAEARKRAGEKSIIPVMLLTLARIHLHLHDTDLARDYATVAIEFGNLKADLFLQAARKILVDCGTINR